MPPKLKSKQTESTQDIDEILKEFPVTQTEIAEAAEKAQKKQVKPKKTLAHIRKEKVAIKSYDFIEITDEDRRNYEILLLHVYNKYAAIYVPTKLETGQGDRWYILTDEIRDSYIKQNLIAVKANRAVVEAEMAQNSEARIRETIEMFQSKWRPITIQYQESLKILKEKALQEIEILVSDKMPNNSQELMAYYRLRLERETGTEMEAMRWLMEASTSALIKKLAPLSIGSWRKKNFNNENYNIILAQQSKFYELDFVRNKQFASNIIELKGYILSTSPESIMQDMEDAKRHLESPSGNVVTIQVVNFNSAYSDYPKEYVKFHQQTYGVTPDEKEHKEKEINKVFRKALKALEEGRKAEYRRSQSFKNAQKALENYEKLLGFAVQETSEQVVSELDCDVTQAFLHLKEPQKAKNPKPETKKAEVEFGLNALKIFLQGRTISTDLSQDILDDPNINPEILIGIKRSYEAVENLFTNHADLSNLLVQNNILSQAESQIIEEACLTQNLRNFFKGQIFLVDGSGRKMVNIKANQMANLLMHNGNFLTFTQKQGIANVIKLATNGDLDLSSPEFIKNVLQGINADQILKDSAHLRFAKDNPKQRLESLEPLFIAIKQLEKSMELGSSFLQYDVACANLMNDFGSFAQDVGADGKDFLNLCKDYRDFVSHGSDKNFAVRIRKYNQDGNVMFQRRLDQIAGMANIKERDLALQEFYLDNFKEKIAPAQNINDLVNKELLLNAKKEVSR